MKDEEFYSTSAVADSIGIPERVLSNLIRNGVIKAPRLELGQGRRRWTEDDLDDARDAYAKYLEGAKASARKAKSRR